MSEWHSGQLLRAALVNPNSTLLLGKQRADVIPATTVRYKAMQHLEASRLLMTTNFSQRRILNTMSLSWP